MDIRDYRAEDELGWVRCRVLSFLDSSYFDDIIRQKEQYAHPAVCLVAEQRGQIVGLIDVEYEQRTGDVCYFSGPLGGVIWSLGVLPEFRREGVATRLFEAAKDALAARGINRLEVWTQDDEPANRWYQRQGFVQRGAYLNAYLKDRESLQGLVDYSALSRRFGAKSVRCLNLEAPIERKDELEPLCSRLHEVRVYERAI